MPSHFRKLSEYVYAFQGLLLAEAHAQLSQAVTAAFDSCATPLLATIQDVARGEALVDAEARARLSGDQRAPRPEDIYIARVAGGGASADVSTGAPIGGGGDWCASAHRLAIVTESRAGADNASPAFRLAMKLVSCAFNAATCITKNISQSWKRFLCCHQSALLVYSV